MFCRPTNGLVLHMARYKLYLLIYYLLYYVSLSCRQASGWNNLLAVGYGL